MPGTRARLAGVVVLLALTASVRATADERVLPPIVVTPSSYSIVEEATSAHDVDMTEAANLPLLDNDILRTVHAFPGVASNDFTARFHLRGSERSGVLVRLDGVDLYYRFLVWGRAYLGLQC